MVVGGDVCTRKQIGMLYTSLVVRIFGCDLRIVEGVAPTHDAITPRIEFQGRTLIIAQLLLRKIHTGDECSVVAENIKSHPVDLFRKNIIRYVAVVAKRQYRIVWTVTHIFLDVATRKQGDCTNQQCFQQIHR